MCGNFVPHDDDHEIVHHAVLMLDLRTRNYGFTVQLFRLWNSLIARLAVVLPPLASQFWQVVDKLGW